MGTQHGDLGRGSGGDVRTHFPIVSSQTQMVIGRFRPDGGGSLFWGGPRTCQDWNLGQKAPSLTRKFFCSLSLSPLQERGRKELNPQPTWLFIYLDEGGRPLEELGH